MGKEVPASAGFGLVSSLIKVYIASVRKGLRIERSAHLNGFWACMNADIAEVGIEGRFHFTASAVGHGLTSTFGAAESLFKFVAHLRWAASTGWIDPGVPG